MKKHIISVTLAIACVSVATATRADIGEATFTPQGADVYQPVPESEVEVFVYKPEFKFKIIGVVEARGMAEVPRGLLDQLDISRYLDPPPPPGEKEDIALAMKALKTEAANAGAHGILIIQSIQVRVTQRATERRIKAIAIRRVE